MINTALEEAISNQYEELFFTVGSPIRYKKHNQMILSSSDVLISEDIDSILLSLIGEDKFSRLEKDKSLLKSCTLEGYGRVRLACGYQRGTKYLNIKLSKNTKNITGFDFPEVVRALSQFQEGLILISGKNHSGKSTTMSFVLDQLNKHQSKNIVTVHQYIEYLMSHEMSLVKQKEIGIDIDSMSKGLEVALQEDADMIFLDEVTDREVIGDMIRASSQGKLIVAVVNASNAYTTIEKMMNAFDPVDQLYYRTQFANVLKCIVSQKMIRLEETKDVLFEIVLNNSGIKRLIIENKLNQLYNLIESYKNLGMRNYNMSLAEKVVKGALSKEASLLLTDNGDELLDYFNRGLMNE